MEENCVNCEGLVANSFELRFLLSKLMLHGAIETRRQRRDFLYAILTRYSAICLTL